LIPTGVTGATSGKRPGIVKESQRNILHCIGNTTLLALRNIVPGNGARILLKLEMRTPRAA
jgi:hypothetical protein